MTHFIWDLVVLLFVIHLAPGPQISLLRIFAKVKNPYNSHSSCVTAARSLYACCCECSPSNGKHQILHKKACLKLPSSLHQQRSRILLQLEDNARELHMCSQKLAPPLGLQSPFQGPTLPHWTLVAQVEEMASYTCRRRCILYRHAM